jgi:hypothetical protein
MIWYRPEANSGKTIVRFAADGIGERNLDSDYVDAKGTHVFGITDFFLCPRVTDSNACVVLRIIQRSMAETMLIVLRWFRAHTWRGQLKLSCDYNAAMLPKEAPESFLTTVVDLLTSISDCTP